MQRRNFLKNTAWSALALTGCTSLNKNSMKEKMPVQPRISLAQWSLNRAFFGGQLAVNDFAAIAKDTFGFEAVEYVNGFYKDQGEKETFWQEMQSRSRNAGVKNLLIMVDDEGNLGNTNDADRKKAVENHYKWVHAAKIMGCHSIRVNAFGEGTKSMVRSALIDGLGQLSNYAAREDINILIENHGLYSSDGKWIVGIIEAAGQTNLGTLPDFGNWCLNTQWGSTQYDKCTEVYDRYQGVLDFLPYAHGVSAKSYNFDDSGSDRVIDYSRMLKIVYDFGYTGYIGIEYEGEELPEPEGIRMTKTLIERVWKELSQA